MSHIQIFDSILKILHASSGCGKYLRSPRIIVLYINSLKCKYVWDNFVVLYKRGVPPKYVQLSFVTFNLSCRMAHFGTQIVPSTCESDVYWTVHHYDNWRIKNQLDATCYIIVLLIGSTCFGHYYAHHQELATIMLITTLVVSFLVCCLLEVRCG